MMDIITILMSELNQKHEDLLKEKWEDSELSMIEDTVV